MKTKNLQKIILFTLLVFSYVVKAQLPPLIQWQNTIGGNASDVDAKVASCLDGGYLIGGTSSSNISCDKSEDNFNGTLFGYERNFWIIKTNSLGVIEWENTIKSSTSEYLTGVKQLPNGQYLVYGYTAGGIAGDKTSAAYGGFDFWILKLDNTGTIVWQTGIGAAGLEQYEIVESTIDGGLVIGGTSTSNSSSIKAENCYGNIDYWIIKLDSLGTIEWENTIGGTGEDYIYDIKQLSDGSYLAGGSSNSPMNIEKTEDTIGKKDMWLVKLDANGNKLWDHVIGGTDDDILYGIEVYDDNRFVLAGESRSGISGNKTEATYGSDDYWIVVVDSTGTLIRQKTIGGSLSDNLSDLLVSLDGKIVVAGHTYSSISGNRTVDTIGMQDLWLVQLDSNLNIEWQKSIGGSSLEYGAQMTLSSANEIVLCANSYSNISGDKIENNCANYDFWLMKLKEPIRTIHGNIYADINRDCALDTAADLGIEHIILYDEISNHYTISQVDGTYEMPVFSDTSILYITNQPTNMQLTCLPVDTLNCYFTTGSAIDSFDVNFPLTGDSCSNLKVDINSSNLRICSRATFTINYSNLGFDTARLAYILVEIDTANFDSIQSVTPFVQSGDTLLFTLGNVSPIYNGTFTFTAKVKCTSIIGTSACTRAYIYPLSDCEPISVDYDSSDIEVTTECLRDTVFARIKNGVTANDMIHPGLVEIIEDDIIQISHPFQLNTGLDTLISYYPGAESTVTIRVYQNAQHPERPIVIKHDELCALTTPLKLYSVINHFSRYDDADEYEEVCSLIVGSLDPNIKSVVPQGFTTQHYTDSNQILEYRIDFQNTGLDTAFEVVIIDTLSSWLNINTFVPLVASHAYRTELEGSNTIKFIFNPIVLPDSNVSEENSHGYVTYKIRPKFNTPKGTVISNYADIYFDFNAPVRTNTVFNTIYDTVLVRLGLGLNEPKENLKASILVFPNPTIDKFYVQLDVSVKDAQIKIMDIQGREVYEMNNFTGSSIEMSASQLHKGIYFIQVYDQHRLIGISKIIVE